MRTAHQLLATSDLYVVHCCFFPTTTQQTAAEGQAGRAGLNILETVRNNLIKILPAIWTFLNSIGLFILVKSVIHFVYLAILEVTACALQTLTNK